MINEDTQIGQLLYILSDIRHAIHHRRIVVHGRSQKFNAALLQAAHGSDDVGGVERDMLHAGAAIEIQVFFNLRFAASLGRLVDGEFDASTAILHDFRHQGGILGTDGAIIKVNELGKDHDDLVKC